MLILWYVGMIFCTISLHILGFISKDSSVDLYVVWAIIVMLITPVESVFIAIIRNNELKREYEERSRKAAELRAKLSEEEKQEQEREKKRAAIEFARRHAEQNKNAAG